MSDSLWSHGLQHARPPCPSPTPGVHPNPCLLSWWCHPTISSSVIPFSSCPQSFPASGSFQVSQLFASGGQSIRASASASVLPWRTYWLKTIQTSSLRVLESEVWNEPHWVGGAGSFKRLWRRMCFLASFTFLWPPVFLAPSSSFRASLEVSASILTLSSLLPISSHLDQHDYMRPSWWFRTTAHLKTLNLITPAKSLFPFKVIFIDSRN